MTSADQAAIAQGQAFVWHEVYSADQAGTIEFYTKALDFGTEEMSMGGMGTYKMLTRNGRPICGTVDTASIGMPDVPPHWAVYISVDDVDAKITLCESLGAKVVVPAMDVPTVGRMALIQDPQGAHVWIFKSADM